MAVFRNALQKAKNELKEKGFTNGIVDITCMMDDYSAKLGGYRYTVTYQNPRLTCALYRLTGGRDILSRRSSRVPVNRLDWDRPENQPENLVDDNVRQFILGWLPPELQENPKAA